MTLLLRLPTKIKKKSNARPKSLVLYIPAQIRDMLEFEHGTPINMEVCLDEKTEQKYIKIYQTD